MFWFFRSSSPPTEEQFTNWRFWRKWLGDQSEQASARFLKRLGYRILARNVRNKKGEIDLIALDQQTLVIVEVRSRMQLSFDAIAQSVDRKKQRKIIRAAQHFLARRRILNVPIRYDILALSWQSKTTPPDIRHYQNAFTLDR